MKPKPVIIFQIALIILLFCTTCIAASIHGTVSPAGIGASVRIEEQDGRVWNIDVNKKGNFHIDSLPAGIYDLEAMADGYVTGYINDTFLKESQPSKEYKFKLIRGGMINGKVFPQTAKPYIQVEVGKNQIYCEIEDGKYFNFEGIPAGIRTVSVKAEGYVPQHHKVQFVSGKTVKLNIKLQRFGCISGWISPSNISGTVIAKKRDGNDLAEGAEIKADGSYKIGNLPPGVYDLIVIAKDYERVVGIGPTPVPDTLSADEKQAIRALFKRIDDSYAKKDAAGITECFCKTFKDSDTGEITDRDEIRRGVQELFDFAEKISNERKIDVIAGKTGKTAVAYSRIHLVITSKDGQNTVKKGDWILSQAQLTKEPGGWKISGGYSSPSYNDDQWGDYPFTVNADFMLPFNQLLDGEQGEVSWVYSADSGVSGIKVSSGIESKCNNYILMPLKLKHELSK